MASTTHFAASLQRTYDSLDRDSTGDFGHCWKLGLNASRMEVTPLTTSHSPSMGSARRATLHSRLRFSAGTRRSSGRSRGSTVVWSPRAAVARACCRFRATTGSADCWARRTRSAAASTRIQRGASTRGRRTSRCNRRRACTGTRSPSPAGRLLTNPDQCAMAATALRAFLAMWNLQVADS